MTTLEHGSVLSLGRSVPRLRVEDGITEKDPVGLVYPCTVGSSLRPRDLAGSASGAEASLVTLRAPRSPGTITSAVPRFPARLCFCATGSWLSACHEPSSPSRSSTSPTTMTVPRAVPATSTLTSRWPPWPGVAHLRSSPNLQEAAPHPVRGVGNSFPEAEVVRDQQGRPGKQPQVPMWSECPWVPTTRVTSPGATPCPARAPGERLLSRGPAVSHEDGAPGRLL